MKKMMKRGASLALAGVLALGLCVGALAAEPESVAKWKTGSGVVAASSNKCGKNVTWKLSKNGTLTISGSGAMYDYDKDQAPPWFESDVPVKKIVIESGVTGIGEAAFALCTEATSVTIPATVKTIDEGAFLKDQSLKSILIPKSVREIEDLAFFGCTSLTKISVVSANKYYSSKDGVLFNKRKTELVQYPCGKKGQYTIPKTVREIEDYAFATSAGLTSVTIPGSVLEIGEGAFASSGIQRVKIPAKVKEIDEDAFANCVNLASVKLGSGVASIEERAFSGCTSLKTITIGKKLRLVEERAFFGCSVLKKVNYAGSKTAWKKVRIAPAGNKKLKSAKIVYNYK